MVKKVQIGSIEVNYYQTGQGQPLILLHGWTNNWQGWEQIIDSLKKDFKIYALDFPGYGDSGDLPSYSLKIEADYVAKFITKLNLKTKPVVIGTSFGSAVVATFARTYPELASKIILIGSPILRNNSLTSFVFKLYSIILDHPFLHHIFLATIKSNAFGYLTAKFLNMYRFDKEIVDRYGFSGRKKLRIRPLLETARSSSETNLEQVITGITLPTLLIWGENDRMVDLNRIRKIASRLDKQRFKTVFVPRCGHVIHFEKPKEACQIITDYLKTR